MAENAYYLTTHPDPHGRGLVAVITLGSPQMGDATTTICAAEIVGDQEAAEAWLARMVVEKPWVERH